MRVDAFHTLEIEVGRDVRIEKDEWDSIPLTTVEESCVPGRGAEVGAIVCGEGEPTSIDSRDNHHKCIFFFELAFLYRNSYLIQMQDTVERTHK